MNLRYYRLLIIPAASLSLLTAACGSNRPTDASIPVETTLAINKPPEQAPESEGIDTESTVFTLLGLAKTPTEKKGPHTGDNVSPSIWDAAHDTLNFVPLIAEDPLAGVMKTDWYSPPGKPNERLRVTVLITSRALRTDSFTVTIEREERSPDGAWKQTPVAQQTVNDLDSAILQRARQIHAQTYRDSM